MSETRTYTVVPSEPGDPENSLRAMSEDGEVFLFAGITITDVKTTAEQFEKNRKEDDDGGK